MKVLQINCVFPDGSTGKIVNDLHENFIKRGYHSKVLYGLGSRSKDINVFKTMNTIERLVNTIYTYISGYMYKGSMASTFRIIRYIKKFKPDVVHLHSVNGHIVNIYRLLNYLRINKINTVITNHGEFFYTGSYTHVPDGSSQWLDGKKEYFPSAKKLTNSIFLDKTYNSIRKFKKIYNGFGTLAITSVSPWINERSKRSYLLKGLPNYMVLNGINTNIFKPLKINKDILLQNYKNEKIILHVTSDYNNPIKGFNTIVEIAKLFSEHKVIIIGAKKDLDLPNNCLNLGKIYDQNLLSQYYSIADISVLTSKKETFSMIVAESLSCGTPVVGYKAGGPESITIDKYSEFVEYGDFDKLSSAINRWISFKEKNSIDISEVHSKYSKEKMLDNYLNVYNSIKTKNKI